MATFVVHARRTQAIISRVVSLFHRRAIDIERLTAEPADDPSVLRVVLEIRPDAGKSERIEANLLKIVDVLSVEQIDARVVPHD